MAEKKSIYVRSLAWEVCIQKCPPGRIPWHLKKLIYLAALENNAASLAKACRAAAAALDLELLSQAPSPAVTAIKAPEPGTAPEIVAAMRDRHGAQLSGGQGDLKPHIFRVGHIGYVDDLDLFGVLAALEGVLADRGHPVTAGAGVAAAVAEIAASRRASGGFNG